MKLRAAALILPVLLVACGDSGGTTPATRTPGLSFGFSGAISGEFRAQGIPGASSYASFAVLMEDEEDALILAQQPRSGLRSDNLLVRLPTTSPGTYAFSGEECPGCALGVFLYDLALDDTLSTPRMYMVTRGNVQVSHSDAQGIRGTFHGTGYEIFSTDSIVIAQGRFDIPRIDLPEWLILTRPALR
jgi:hypothetical protein